MKNNENSEPDVKSAIEKIGRKAIGDFSKIKKNFTKKQLFRIKTTLDNICMFVGENALPEDFFKETGMSSQIKNMDHVPMLMGYPKHEIISIEALFNEKDLELFIRKLIEDNGEKIFAMVIMFSDHAVCLGWDGKNLGSVNHDKTENSNNPEDFKKIIENIKICNYKQQVSGEKTPKAAANISIFGRPDDKLNLKSMDSIQLTMENAEKASLLLSCDMVKNNIQHIETCIKKIINSQLPLENTISLLKAAYLKIPALCLALQNDMTKTVKEFTKVILESSLDDDTKLDDSIKLKLLSAKRGDETPGLFMSLQSGHTETVKAFTPLILDSDLDNKTKLELLSAKKSNKTPGLFMSFQKGHTETVMAFTPLILDSNLNDDTKLELLSAKRGDGITGLYIAFQEGHTETFTEFTELILDSYLDDESELKMMCQNILKKMDDSNSSKK